jgi:hypothetical protein
MAAAGAFVLLTSPHLPAQTTLGTIIGEATDSSGAVLPEVEVVVRNVATNIEHRAKTGGNGLYQVTNLAPGRYSISAQRAGFRSLTLSDVMLETSATVRADLRLDVGDLTTRVTVEATAPVINTEGAEVANVRDSRMLLQSPVNYRGDSASGYYSAMIVLTPGAHRAQGSNFSFAGTRGNQYGGTVDGTNMVADFGSTLFAAQSSLDSTQEMRLQLANDKAEAATPGGVYAATKSGGNTLHGSLFQYHTNSRLSARNPFSTTVPFTIINNYGGTIGGPIRTNRTFFFGSYERFAQRREAILNRNVPTLAMRAGDFASLLPRTVVRDPANGQPFPGNVIPPDRLNASSLKVQERFYPRPNAGSPDSSQSNLLDTLAQPLFKTQIEGRIDHKLSSSNSLFGRTMWNRGGYDYLVAEVPAFPDTRGVRSTTLITIGDTHIFTPTLINEFRFGTMREQYPVSTALDGAALVREFGLEGLPSTFPIPTGSPRFTVTGFAALGTGTFFAPREDRQRHTQFVDNLTWIRGSHTVKTGVDVRRNSTSNFPGGSGFVSRVFGAFSFTGVYTGFSYADFLLGIPQTSNRVNPAPLYSLVNTDVAAFVQDDWKITPRLTLNIGLRYDFNPAYHEPRGLFFHFDPGTGRLIVPNERSRASVNALFPANLAPIVVASEAGLPEKLFFSDRNNLFPRFGLAFRPFRDARTVIRGGYGIYTDVMDASLYDNTVGGPFLSDETFTNSIVGGVPRFAFPRAFPEGFGAIGVQNFTANDPSLRIPYIQQWSLTVEREFYDTGIRVSYIGTNTRHLIYAPNINQPPPGTQPFNNNLRRFPAFRDVVFRQNGGNHDYHSLHVVGERKMRNGLYYQLGWTWSKTLTDVLSDSEGGSRPENSLARHLERTNADYVPRHRVVGNLAYELPFGPGRPWLTNLKGAPKLLLGGWTLTSILFLQTGQFFNPTFSGFDVSNTNTLGGRPDRVAGGNLPESERSLGRWFDVSAFRVPGDVTGDGRPDVAVGRFGNSAPNLLVGPGLFLLHAGLFKRIPIQERFSLTLEGTFQNALNHPNWGVPLSNISDPGSVGSIRSTQGGLRSGRVGARIEF